MFANFNITLNITEESPINNSLQELFFTQSSFVGKIFAEVNFDWCISFIETLPLIFPYFNSLVTLLLYVMPTHLNVLSLLHSLLSIGICKRGTCFLTWSVVIVTPHSFKDSVTMITNPIYTEAINFLLSTSSGITLNFALWSTLLKIPQNHNLKGLGFVLASECLVFIIVLPSRIRPSWHWLKHWVGIKLTSIDTDNWFAQVWWFAYKSFIHYSFTCKDNRRTANHIFS